MNSFGEHSGQFGATVCWFKWWRKEKFWLLLIKVTFSSTAHEPLAFRDTF